MKQPFCAPSEALRRVLDAAAALPRPAAETLPLDDAVGRIAAEPLSARMDQPPFDRSPLDGYALHSADTAGARLSHSRPRRCGFLEEVYETAFLCAL